MIHEIIVGVVCDSDTEATVVLDDLAESYGMAVAETSVELLDSDPSDPESDLIDGVLVQARLERHDHAD